MKILHILNELQYSGAEVMLKVAKPTFDQYGLNSHILATGGEIGPYATVLRECGYTVHLIPFGRNLSFLRAVYSFLRAEQFEAVHMHSERAFFWYALLSWATGSGRIVRSIHHPFEFSGFLRLKRMLQRHLARKLFGVRYVAISESVQQAEASHFWNQTLVVKNWIDSDHFRPAVGDEKANARGRIGLKQDDFVVISVGACTEVKNHPAVLEAVAKVRHLTGGSIKYLHRGEGPMREKEEEYARELGVHDRVLFLDFSNDLREDYWSADTFVMTSRREGLGNAILEAMSCGLPVVLYNVLGMRDTIDGEKGGMLVEPNPSALASALEELIRNQELRKMMGVEARRTVLKNFDMRRSVESLLKLYQGECVSHIDL